METRKVNKLLEKYWEGDTSLAEEKELSTYFNSDQVDPTLVDHKALFVYFKEASETSYAKNPSTYIQAETKTVPLQKKSETKVFSLKRLSAIAAAVLFIAAAIFGINQMDGTDKIQAGYVQEIEDVDEAYEITREALAFLSNKYQKGTDPLATLPESIKSTRIFK